MSIVVVPYLNTSAFERLIKSFESIDEDKNVKEHIGEMYASAIKPLVPYKTGALSKNYTIKVNDTMVVIEWGTKYHLDYTHYQYVGDIYGPNRPRFRFSKGDKSWYHRGWSSPKDKTKTNTHRKIGSFKGTLYNKYGTPFTIDGYTTSGTGAEWIKTFRTTPELYYPVRYNATDYLRREWRKRKPNV